MRWTRRNYALLLLSSIVTMWQTTAAAPAAANVSNNNSNTNNVTARPGILSRLHEMYKRAEYNAYVLLTVLNPFFWVHFNDRPSKRQHDPIVIVRQPLMWEPPHFINISETQEPIVPPWAAAVFRPV